MFRKTYPSFGQVLVLLLFLLVTGLAGFPGYIPYLIWKIEFTHNIGYISIYVAAFVLTIQKAVNTIRRSGDQFSIFTHLKKNADWVQVVLLIFLTLTIGSCLSFLTLYLNLKDFFEAEVTISSRFCFHKLGVLQFFKRLIFLAYKAQIGNKELQNIPILSSCNYYFIEECIERIIRSSQMPSVLSSCTKILSYE